MDNGGTHTDGPKDKKVDEYVQDIYIYIYRERERESVLSSWFFYFNGPHSLIPLDGFWFMQNLNHLSMVEF